MLRPTLRLIHVATALFSLEGISTLQAASFSFEPLSTRFEMPDDPRVGMSSTGATFDLNDRSGLVPGAPIRIEVSGSAVLRWEATFGGDTVGSTVLVLAAQSIAFGVDGSGFFDVRNEARVYEFGVETASELEFDESFEHDISAYSTVVPWESDLSVVTLSLTQQAGTEMGSVVKSRLFFEDTSSDSKGFLIQTSSVPEPTVTMLCGLAGFVLLLRSRK